MTESFVFFFISAHTLGRARLHNHPVFLTVILMCLYMRISGMSLVGSIKEQDVERDIFEL